MLQNLWVIRSPTTLILEKKNEPIPKGTCRWITPGVTFQLSTSTVCISTFLSKVCCYGVWLTHWLWETKCHLKSSAKNMQSNRWPFKSQVFHTVHWALKFWCQRVHTPVTWDCYQNISDWLRVSYYTKICLFWNLFCSSSKSCVLVGLPCLAFFTIGKDMWQEIL